MLAVHSLRTANRGRILIATSENANSPCKAESAAIPRRMAPLFLSHIFL